MKVVEFIKRLEEIEYDENTELTFGCCDENGEFYYLNIDALDGDGFYYGEDFNGYPYNKQEINIGIDVEGCRDYVDSKKHFAHEVLDRISEIIDNYNMMYRE